MEDLKSSIIEIKTMMLCIPNINTNDLKEETIGALQHSNL